MLRSYGLWVCIFPIPGLASLSELFKYVINVGETLQKLSTQRFKSTWNAYPLEDKTLEVINQH
jgi:hypothetical protein